MIATSPSTDLITALNAPAIPGLIFRRFHGPSDYPHMLAVINGSKKADDIERSDTLEAMINNYAHLENCDPYRDMVMAEVDGQMIAYNRAFWEQQEDGTRIYTVFGFLLPEWRRTGNWHNHAGSWRATPARDCRGARLPRAALLPILCVRR